MFIFFYALPRFFFCTSILVFTMGAALVVSMFAGGIIGGAVTNGLQEYQVQQQIAQLKTQMVKYAQTMEKVIGDYETKISQPLLNEISTTKSRIKDLKQSIGVQRQTAQRTKQIVSLVGIILIIAVVTLLVLKLFNVIPGKQAMINDKLESQDAILAGAVLQLEGKGNA